MSQIQFNNGVILFSEGAVALDPACCCDCQLISYPTLGNCQYYDTILAMAVTKPDVRVIITGIGVPTGDITCTDCVDMNVDVTLSCGEEYPLFPLFGFYCESNNPITTGIGTYVRRVQPDISQCYIEYTSVGIIVHLKVVSDPATGGFPFDGANSTRFNYHLVYEYEDLVLPKYSNCPPGDPRGEETVTFNHGSNNLVLVSETLDYSGPDVGTEVQDLLCDMAAISVSVNTV